MQFSFAIFLTETEFDLTQGEAKIRDPHELPGRDETQVQKLGLRGYLSPSTWIMNLYFIKITVLGHAHFMRLPQKA